MIRQDDYENNENNENVFNESVGLETTDSEMPKGLTGGAKKTWLEYMSKYKKFLNPLDKQVFAQFCITKDIYDNLYNTWKRKGKKVYVKVDIFNKSGELTGSKEVVNPLFKEIREQEKRVTALAEELGFTPKGRKRLNIDTNEKPVNNDEDLFD